VETAVDDALLVYFAHPGRFNRARGSLPAWLGKIAANRARDLRRQSRRRSGHEVISGVDVSVFARWLGNPDPTPPPDTKSIVTRILSLGRNDRERAFLHARLTGASPDAQAGALGAGDLPPEERRRVIYRAMQRIVKRARRSRRF
jgi:DNA-directed RNA polymerase specialized sigma24 family protein